MEETTPDLSGFQPQHRAAARGQHAWMRLRELVEHAFLDIAKRLFTGMFERTEGKANVKKGQFAQALAQGISESHAAIELPTYLKSALDTVTGAVAKGPVGV